MVHLLVQDCFLKNINYKRNIVLKPYTYLLLPRKFRTAGWIILIPGVLLAIIRFYYGIKPAVFNFKSFAIYSSYIKTNYFTLIENHFSEEIAGVLILLGLIFIAFSKEEQETEELKGLRLKTFVLSIYINTLFLILSIIFVFGFGFLTVLNLNLFSTLLIYIVIFRYKLYKLGKPPLRSAN